MPREKRPYSLHVLGTPYLEYHEETVKISRRKSFGLIVYLAVTQQPHTRDKLASIFWPTHDQSRARANLRRSLAEIRTLLPPDSFETDGEFVTINESPSLWVDLNTFLKLIYAQSDPSLSDASGLIQAVDLYQDSFLAGFTIPDTPLFDQWQRYEEYRLKGHYMEALLQLIDWHTNQELHNEAIEYARRLIFADPTNEIAHRYLMHLYTLTGQRNMALQQYITCTSVLSDELGIMPEAETTALYESIRDTHRSQAIYLKPRKSWAGTLPPLPRLMIGRDRVIGELKSRLLSSAVRQVIVQGWPGLGKTTLAAALAHDPDLVEAFPDGILWTSLGQEPYFQPLFTQWADALGISTNTAHIDIDDVTNQMSALLHDRRMLLIVDDVWDANHAALFQVGGKRCKMLLTTRSNGIASRLASLPDDVYKLPVLSDEDGLALLRALTPQTVAQHPDQSLELVQNLEGLPLALQVAGRLLVAEMNLGWGVIELLDELNEGSRILQANAPLDIQPDAPPITVSALLAKSSSVLDDTTRKYFALLGVFAPKPATFSLDAIKAAWGVDNPRPFIRTLVDRGLLEPTGGGHFQMHALIARHAISLFNE